MYGMNKKMYKPVTGGKRIQQPGGGARPMGGNQLASAKKALDNASMRKRVLQKLRGA